MKKQPKKQTASKKPSVGRDAVESRGTAVLEMPVKPASQCSKPGPTAEQIQARAFEIYQRNGCRPGRAMEDWLQAERELTVK